MKRKLEESLLLGRIATNIGDSLFYMLIIWYFNEHFSSSILLSIVFAITSIVDACSFLFGPLIDKTNPKQNLYFVSFFQTLSVGVLLVFCILIRSRSKEFRMILFLFLFLIYIGSSIIYPSSEKLIPLIAEEKDLIRVNSIFHTSEKVLDVLFNAVSTIVISFFDFNFVILIVFCFFAIATKFYKLTIIFLNKKGSFFACNKIENKSEYETYSISVYFRDLVNGVKELKYHSEVLRLFLPLSIVNLFYGVAMVGLPVVSGLYINHKAYGYGSLLMFASFGGVFGSILINKFSNSIYNPKKYTAIFLGIAGICWLFIAITLPICFIWSFPLIFIANCAINMMNVMFVTLIQKQINPLLLGRVSTFTESLVSIMIPFGNFLGGIVLTITSSFVTLGLYGAALIVCAVPYLLFKNSK